MNTPVSFKLAKLLKEKGWNKPELNFYFEDGTFSENVFRDSVGMDYGSQFKVEFSELIENWNDKWLTKKNGNRCFGCDKSKGYFETFSAPTIADVVMWYYENHGIWIEPRRVSEKEFCCFYVGNNGYPIEIPETFKSPVEAYEAAFEYILNNLL